MKRATLKLVLAALLIPLAGCATIVGNDTHVMPIVSTPSDASISIIDEKGVEIFKGNTPSTIALKKSDGTYFGKKSYTVTISKPGFATQTIPVTASPSGWYIGGNLFFGGLIGWLVVDPLNGKMYNLSPEHVAADLPDNAKTSHNNKSTNGGITVMLIQDMPENLRGKLSALN